MTALGERPFAATATRHGEPVVKRRRRSREVAQAEILGAAEEILRERPFRDLNVEDVMARTSLSRSSFYVYFRDRHDLLLRLTEELGDEIYAAAERWFAGDSEPQIALADGLAAVVGVYGRHGRVLRAISDAAATDTEAERVYLGLVGRFVDANTVNFTEQTEAGLLSGLHPRETASALTWMTERYLSQAFGGPEPLVPEYEAARTLQQVWLRTLYP